ncbi:MULTISPECIES: adenylosuccinate synthetase [unclassified Gordonia (in: high G+C Gram-positive bacteria)]|jgi:adenylosuccinate synthase
MTHQENRTPATRPHGSPIVVVGLGYGDEAKGATVDVLASTIPDTAAVVRFSGGAQAAHNVCHGARHHTFRQFGSASLLDVRTILRAPMMINPLLLAVEAAGLARLGVVEPLGLIGADARALVTTPIHAAMNRARESLRGNARHGSCGEGIGETRAYDLAVARGARAGETIGNFRVYADAPDVAPLTMGMLRDRRAIVRSLDALSAFARPLLTAAGADGIESVGTIADALTDIASAITILDDADAHLAATLASGTVIFEGSQGALLDEWHGFHPHTTWSTVLPGALRRELTAAGHRPTVLGATRCYATRHGAGPMPTEAAHPELPDTHNREGRYQGAWRTGHLDLPALRYAAAICGGLDGVAVSHLDVLGTPGLAVADSWNGVHTPVRPTPAGDLDRLGELTRIAAAARPDLRPLPTSAGEVTRLISEATGAPVVITADGPRRTDRSITWPAPTRTPPTSPAPTARPRAVSTRPS